MQRRQNSRWPRQRQDRRSRSEARRGGSENCRDREPTGRRPLAIEHAYRGHRSARRTGLSTSARPIHDHEHYGRARRRVPNLAGLPGPDHRRQFRAGRIFKADGRRRGLDNLSKAVLDLLVTQRSLGDDSQVVLPTTDWVEGDEARADVAVIKAEDPGLVTVSKPCVPQAKAPTRINRPLGNI